MKSLLPALVVLVLPVNLPVSAAGSPAYAVLRIPTTPEQIVSMRFPNLAVCQRELDGLKALLAEELGRPVARRLDLVRPDAIPGHVLAQPQIDGTCRTVTPRQLR